MSSGLRRPKTAGPAGSFQKSKFGGLDDQLMPAATVSRLQKRPGSQMSLRSGAGNREQDASCWPQYVPIRRVPSAMKRNMEIQTDASPLPTAMGLSTGQGPSNGPAGAANNNPAVSGGGALFYPYYVPGLQDAAGGGSGVQQQPYVLLSPWQLPGYQNLPVLDPAQLKLLDPMVRRQSTGSHPLDGAPIYRSGRNGSCWRHIKHCVGNLGNNIMFIDGHVKEEDCKRFPPHGYPSASTAGLSVHNRLAPKAQSRLAAGLGLPRGNPLGNPARPAAGDLRQSLAMERAKTGTKYWYEDSTPAPLVPTTVQGRIMKSGSAY